MSTYNTNFIATVNGVQQDLGTILYNWSSNTVNISAAGFTYQRYPIRYKKPTIILETDITATMDGQPGYGDQVITFGPQVQGRFVALGTGGSAGAIFTNDGIVINAVVSVPSNANTGVKWDGSKWFGMINGNVNANSYDLTSWQATGVTATAGSGGYGRRAAYNGAIYLVTMYNTSAILAYSYDGVNWTAATSYTSAGAIGYAIAWNGVVWLSGNQSSSPLGYSYDGVNWTAVPSGSSYFSAGVSDIIWTGNRWIAAGWGSGSFPGTTPQLAYTTDPTGVTGWTSVNISSYATGIGITSLSWNGKVIASSGGWSNRQAYSYDAITWLTSNIYLNIYSGNASGPIRWNGQLFLQGASGTNSLSYSYNGLYYTGSTGFSALTSANCIEYNVRRPHSIKFNRKIMIATMGGSTVGNSLLYSYDGISWTGLGTSVFASQAFSSTYNGRIWIGGGQGGNTLGFSQNGISWKGLGSSAFTTSCNTVIWNNIKNMWLAGGQGTNTTVQYSYDGYTWIQVVSSPFSTICNGFAYNTSLIVAVGSGTNTMATSINGISWVSLGSPLSTTSMNGIATNGSLWVAVGGTSSVGKILYSYNGTTWVDTGYTGFSTAGYAVAYNPTMWVAVGAGTTSVAYSYNGINWNNGINLFSYRGYGVQWNGTLWSIVGKSASFNTAYSYDGINWIGNNIGGNTQTIITPNIGALWTQTSASSASWYCITSSSDGTKLAACVQNGYIYVSSDSGSTWSPTSAPSKYWQCITSSSDGTKLAACVRDGYIYVSSNSGSTWTNTSAPSVSWYSITSSSDGTKLAACVQNGYIYVSSNSGSTWTQTSAPSAYWRCITSSSDGTKLAACVFYGGLIYVSTNSGSTWSPTSAPSLYWYSITSSSDGTQLAACVNRGNIYVSSDSGSTWTPTSAPYSTWGGITSSSDGSKLAACVQNGYIYTFSLYTTTLIGSTITNTVSNYQVQPKAFIQHGSLAFGSSGIAYSPDGINWTGLGATIFTTQARKAFWSGSMWIAGGSGTNTLAYSYDGTSWTGLGSSVITGQVNGVAYNGSIWVAGGYGTYSLAYSTDGMNWRGVIGSASIFSNAGYGFAWNGTAWLATGYGTNTIAVSTNGIIWTAVANTNSATTGYVYPATNGSLWVVPVNSSVGLMYSSVINGQSGWTNVTSSPFSSGGLCVTYNGSIWVAGGSGTNQIAYSTNGTSWTGISTAFTSVNDIVWNGTRFIAIGGSLIGYSADGIKWYTSTSILSTGYGLASNPGVGAFVAPSALVLSDTGIAGNGIAASNTLEIVSSDPYFQNGFTNISVKVESNNIY